MSQSTGRTLSLIDRDTSAFKVVPSVQFHLSIGHPFNDAEQSKSEGQRATGRSHRWRRLPVGAGLRSCTNDVQICRPFELDGRRVTLVDTPGFDDTTKSDTDVLAMIAAFLTASSVRLPYFSQQLTEVPRRRYEQGKTLSGIIYLHRISDFRMSGLSTRNFRMLRHLCGEKTLKNLAIVTNMWGEVPAAVGEARERSLRRRTCSSSPLWTRNEMVDSGMDLSETAAGGELRAELAALIQKHEQEIRTLKSEMDEGVYYITQSIPWANPLLHTALRLKDQELRDELGAEISKLQGEAKRIQRDAQDMASRYESEKHRLEAQIRDTAEATRAEQARLTREYEGKLGELERKIREGANNQEVLELRKKILQLETQMANTPSRGGRRGGCVIL
ncbi:Lanosterol alpha-demethylase [Salix suchowensis]|nr:Lanosterol alpha-demethylase [Salix suchowensis]